MSEIPRISTEWKVGEVPKREISFEKIKVAPVFKKPSSGSTERSSDDRGEDSKGEVQMLTGFLTVDAGTYDTWDRAKKEKAG
ncbi:hypothetical protein NPIL_112621 [Nephila pilipes]|uniref:Uncharacterized protein n=1 Tax=Nephila pilipes TaxID=299642 RepID=A0A8X6T675_NEPPI|nr:hypothetical protein NPIL_112621 [Nephila pilipes]